mgnify:CR=1 FL=1|jgi:hypothetical protein
MKSLVKEADQTKLSDLGDDRVDLANAIATIIQQYSRSEVWLFFNKIKAERPENAQDILTVESKIMKYYEWLSLE